MSEFKFACPVCGQHIKCESDKTGTQMECPTCYRKIVVPQATAAEESKFVLTAAQVQSRPVPQSVASSDAPKVDSLSAGKFLFAVFVLLLVAGTAGAGFFIFRAKHLRPAPEEIATETDLPVVKAPPPPPANDTNWMLNLTDAVIPDKPAAGRIYGIEFLYDRAILQGGTLHLMRGTNTPTDLGVTVRTFAKQAEELAGRSISITTNRPRPMPRVTLRWKDEEQNPVILNFGEEYALQLEFGQIKSNRITAKIYLCLPDDAHSYVAGTFEAEIRKTPPTKPRPIVRPKRKP